MVVALLIDGRRIELANTKCRTSEMIMNLLSDLVLGSVDIDVPSEYSSVVDEYVAYVDSIAVDSDGNVTTIHSSAMSTLLINDVNILVRCFFMETFFADNAFLSHLIKCAYDIWYEFLPYIASLPNKRQIYLHSPYEFVPDDYMGREVFFNEWMMVNSNTDVILNGNEICRTIVTYYPTTTTTSLQQLNHPTTTTSLQSQQIKKLFTEHKVKRPRDDSMIGRWFGDIWTGGDQRMIAYSFEQTWYQGPNRQVEYRKIYKNGRIDNVWSNWCKGIRPEIGSSLDKSNRFDGSWMLWCRNGQPAYRHSYKDGKFDGEWLHWYVSGQLCSRHNYKGGLYHGIWETWYQLSTKQLLSHTVPQPSSRYGFRDGYADGLWTDWDRNGQIVSEQYFKLGYLGRLITVPTFYA